MYNYNRDVGNRKDNFCRGTLLSILQRLAKNRQHTYAINLDPAVRTVPY